MYNDCTIIHPNRLLSKDIPEFKDYKAIFFDWDGTAVADRAADATEVAGLMTELLELGKILVVISGTSYENITDEMLSKIPAQLRSGLFFGVSRGAYNYSFDEAGERTELSTLIPNREMRMALHQSVFEFHEWLIDTYDYETDIVFSRPNYCKLDMLVNVNRGSKMYISEGEMDALMQNLKNHSVEMTIEQLFDKQKEIANQVGLTHELKISTDAKYFEIGIGTKTDNVKDLWAFVSKQGIRPDEVCFFGDEFSALAEGVTGSDGFMIIPELMDADYFDVSPAPRLLPPNVHSLKGGPETFLSFLRGQIKGAAV